MRIAVVGSGISGLGAAWLLGQRHEVVLYEAQARLGGHSNTVEVPFGRGTVPVDTGFIVYNDKNYPTLRRLFEHLDIETRPSEMSFSVSVDQGRIEYAGSSIAALFAQKRNLLRPGFQRMIADILRFNADAPRFLDDPASEAVTLGDYLDRRRFGGFFRRHYLLPMAAAIWSASLEAIERYPARSFLAFFRNHGLLTVRHQLPWRTVAGGSRRYVASLLRPIRGGLRPATPVVSLRRAEGGVEVVDGGGGRDRFDQVVLACHADAALRMIEAPQAKERAILGAFGYQDNLAVLHQDRALMPRREEVWASWNYLADSRRPGRAGVAVTYWMNRLQGIDPACPLFVSLNPLADPAPGTEIARFDYRHPVFDQGTLAAQARLQEIQGRDRLWFAGAWCGHGFHEDGLVAGFSVARALGVRPPWERDAERARPAAAATLPAAAAPW